MTLTKMLVIYAFLSHPNDTVDSALNCKDHISLLKPPGRGKKIQCKIKSQCKSKSLPRVQQIKVLPSVLSIWLF